MKTIIRERSSNQTAQPAGSLAGSPAGRESGLRTSGSEPVLPAIRLEITAAAPGRRLVVATGEVIDLAEGAPGVGEKE
jgi:hypothetical protein